MGPSPLSWLTGLYDGNATWNPSFVDDPDLNNWTWYYYVLSNTSTPTVQEVVNWITTKVQTEIYPCLWIAQYPRYAAKSKDWVGDPGFWNNDFEHFVYGQEDPTEPDVIIPGFPLVYIVFSSGLAMISFIYLKKKKFLLKR
jgi:hypothetical protein